jgi:type I restriction enzyme S subunit
MEFTLEEICLMQSGGTPKRTNNHFYGGEIPWVTISDFKNSQEDVIYKTEQTLTDEGLDAINRRLFKKNTLLLAMYGSVGKTAILGVDASTNQAILGINPKDEKVLNIKFLKYWIDFNKDFLYSQGKGAALHNISLTIVQRQKINLPDLETQNKVVAILDKAQGILNKRSQTIQLYSELLKATFLEMFGDPVSNSKNWNQLSLAEICSKITDGTHKTPVYLSKGTPFISAKNIVNNSISWDDIKYISESESNTINSRCNPEFEDILLTKSGSLGQVALVNVDFKFSLFESLALIKYKRDVVLPAFLISYLMSDGVGYFYSQRHKGVAIKHLHLIDIKSIPVFLPPIDIQKEFEFKYNQILKLTTQIRHSRDKCHELLKSLSQQVFSDRITIDIDAELEALINAIDLEKKDEENKVDSIKNDLTFLQRLIDKLQEQEFEASDKYEKAKYIAFKIMKEERDLIKQRFNPSAKKVTLEL